jgi:tetratricopeptide (TPR) repeat protein
VARNPVRAEGAFRGAIEKDGTFGEAHAGLALALWRQYEVGRAPELVEPALAAARRAVTLAPSLPEAHLALGVVQLGRGRTPEAALSFERAQELAPADDAVCRRIADAYSELKRTEDADRFYRRAIELRPEYWENYNRRGSFYLRIGKVAEAKPLFRKVIDLRPESDLGYSNLAGAHILAGELEQAEPLLQAALRIQPSARAQNNLGFVYYGTGRFEQAAGAFRAATQADSEKANYWGNLGDAYRLLARTSEARVAYARAIELGAARLEVNPADAQARAALAMRLAGSKRCGEVRPHAARAVGESPDDPTVHYYAALAYALCGDRAMAIRHAARAIEGGVVADVRTNPDLKPLLADPALRRLLH